MRQINTESLILLFDLLFVIVKMLLQCMAMQIKLIVQLLLVDNNGPLANNCKQEIIKVRE